MAAAAGEPLSNRLFVGRDSELQSLRLAFDDAARGEGRCAVVVGEPGIGKTAICEQLIASVRELGGRIFVGPCYEEASFAYLPFIEALRDYILVQEPEPLRREAGIGAPFLARILPELAERLDIQPAERSDPEEDRWRLLQAVTDFLRAVAVATPLLLVMEDLHWADQGTLDLLRHLARNLGGSRLLIVGTYRDVEVDRSHPLSAALADLRRARNFQRLAVRGLSVEDVHQLYEAVRGSEVPFARAELVHRHTEGNPLFVHEVLRYLLEEGHVLRSGEQYVYASNVPLESVVPEGLRDVVGKRLSRLSEGANRMLSIASVIGRDFRLDVLRQFFPLPEEDLLAALEEATERGVLEQRPTMGQVVFRFTHAFFKQTLYDEIFAPRRIRWHQQVGEALEQVHARRLEDHAAELAEHFAQSTEDTDLEKAVRYCRLATQRAMHVYAYGEAVRHLEQALRTQDVLDPDDAATLCDLQLALAEALLALGERERVSGDTARRALSLAEGLADRDRAWQACRIAVDATSGAQTPELSHWQEIAERYAADNPRARLRLIVSLAATANQYLRRREAEALIREGLDLARRSGNVEAEFNVVNLALGFNVLPPREDYRLLEEYETRTADGIADLTIRSNFLSSRAKAHLSWGHRQRALDLGEELEAFADHTRYTHAILSSRNLFGLFDLLDGRLEQAAEHSMTEWRRWEHRLELLPRAAIYLGDLEQARGYIALLTPIAGHPLVRASRGIVLALSSEVGQAGDILARLLEECPPGNEDDLTNQAGCLLLELALAVRDQTAVQQLYLALHGRDRDRPLAGPNAWICRPRLLGDAAVLLGRQDEARAHYETARDFCQAIGHRPELALSRLGLAEVLLEYHPDERNAASEHLDLAIDECGGMKMQPALERALALRATMGPGPNGPRYPDGLSGREVEVLRLLAAGKSNQQIADELVISLNTVARHISNIFDKTASANRVEAAAYAFRHSLA